MAIHKVKNPFFCRRDQFAIKGFPGQVLVVGIALDALRGDLYKMRLGTNSTVYESPVTDILATGQKWLNRKGKVVLITPVDLFTKKGVVNGISQEVIERGGSSLSASHRSPTVL